MGNLVGAYASGYTDYPHLTAQWDMQMCQVALVNPHRLAVFNDQIIEEGCSPYLVGDERAITLLGYFPVLSYTTETFTASAELMNSVTLDLGPILEPDNWAIIIDTSSSQIIQAGKIQRWHKYPHMAASRMIMEKDSGPVNYEEFIQGTLEALGSR